MRPKFCVYKIEAWQKIEYSSAEMGLMSHYVSPNPTICHPLNLLSTNLILSPFLLNLPIFSVLPLSGLCYRPYGISLTLCTKKRKRNLGIEQDKTQKQMMTIASVGTTKFLFGTRNWILDNGVCMGNLSLVLRILHVYGHMFRQSHMSLGEDWPSVLRES